MADNFEERGERPERGDREERGGYDRGDRGGRFRSRKQTNCECSNLDYKVPSSLSRYLTETGKIRPRRQTGFCAKCQRKLAVQVKRARHMALIPFDGELVRE